MKMRFNHADAKAKKLDTPTSTLKKVRHLIEKEDYYSTTELAERLNGFLPGDERPSEPKFPRATGAGDWTSADVSSLLDRKDMEDLKPRLAANRPKEEEVPIGGGVSPLEFRQALANDLCVLLKAQNKDLSTTLGGIREKLDYLRGEVGSIDASNLDMTAIKAAVAEAMNTKLRTQSTTDATQILDKVVADTADEVCSVFEKVIEKTDFPGVKRMSEAAAKNVGEVCKKIDDLTQELFDTMKEGLDESATTVSSIVVEHLNERMAAFMTQVNEQTQATIDKGIGGILENAIKEAMGSIQNSHAIQASHFERTVRSVIGTQVASKLDLIEKRLKKLEEAESGWNEQALSP